MFSRPTIDSTMSDPPNESDELFRSEVYIAKRDTWLGNVVLVRPTSFAFLSLFSLTISACVLAFLFFGDYTRKTKVTGYVVASQGVIKISTRQAGSIADLRVKEGQRVAEGEIIAVVD